MENTDELYIRIIYIYIGYKNDEEDGCLPLFIVKKCDAMSEPCLMFIDHTCRVYEGWTSYLGNNKLPKCRMYCPKNGKYSGSIQINTVSIIFYHLHAKLGTIRKYFFLNCILRNGSYKKHIATMSAIAV